MNLKKKHLLQSDLHRSRPLEMGDAGAWLENEVPGNNTAKNNESDHTYRRREERQTRLQTMGGGRA